LELWLEVIASITDNEQLVHMKEQLKNEVLENITWEKRMELYKKVQHINQRIQEINIKT